MNLSELAFSFITGQWKIDRIRAQEVLEVTKRSRSSRVSRMYAGAEPGTKRPTPNQLNSPEDYRPAFQRIVLIRAAREMEEDFPFFDALLSDFETYVVGDALKYTPTTGSEGADKAIREFLEWKFDVCDLTGREDLTGMAKLAVRSMKRDGEMGGATVASGEDLKLQFISADRIGNPMTGTSAAAWNFGGIVVNPATGAPIKFEIFNRQPKLNSYTFDRAIPADQFLHYFNPFRIDQYHGVSIFKNAIEHGFDMQQILEFTKLNIKWRASQLPYVTNEQGKPRGSGYEQQATVNGQPQPFSIQTDGVTQTFMKLGEGVMEYPSDFPNTQFQNIMTELKRECAVGAKLPLEFVYRSEAGGVVQRFYADKAEATFRGDRHLLKRKLLNPYKNRLIENGIRTGELDLKAFGKLKEDPLRFAGRWQMGRSVSVDYGREVDADIKQIESGLMSPEDYADDNGRDLSVILDETGRYTRKIFALGTALAAEFKVPFDQVMPYLSKRFVNQAPAAGGAQGGDPSAEDPNAPAILPEPGAETPPTE